MNGVTPFGNGWTYNQSFGLRGDSLLKRLLLIPFALGLLSSLSAQVFTPEGTSRPVTKVPIRRITFQSAPLLSSEDRREISRALRSEEVEADSSPWDPSGLADEAAERVRAAYQNDGYFKVQVDARLVPVTRETAAKYDVLVQVSEEGKQYRLGNLYFLHMKAFPESQLRDLFPIERGEIFSREKIAKGLEKLRRVYGDNGYINYTGVPNTEFDETNNTIDLGVDVDEGHLFHWGSLHADGMRDQDREIVLNAWEGYRGQVYRSGDQELDRFVRKFFQPLRKGQTWPNAQSRKSTM
jgi:outer membrane protein assembly factor BamA